MPPRRLHRNGTQACHRPGIALLGAALLFCTTLAGATFSEAPSQVAQMQTQPGVQLQLGMAPPAGIGAPLTLIGVDGRPFDMTRLAGRPALIFFGFTQCAATCPVAMLTAAQLLAGFVAADSPSIVFVTLDPLSDSPDALRRYLDRFDRRLIGLTGSPASIESAAQAWGVSLRANPSAGPDHSSVWYLLDADGRLARVYPNSTSAAELAAEIQRLGPTTQREPSDAS